MKKILLTLIVSLAFGGSIFAQETHWPEFNQYNYENNDDIVAFIQLDDNFIEGTDNYTDFEVGAFLGESIRGHAFMVDYFEEYGDPHPVIELAVYYDPNEVNYPISFVLYNHSTGVAYTNWTSNIGLFLGVDHIEEYDNYDEAVILSFTSPMPALPEVTVSNDEQMVCMNSDITDMEITATNATITSVEGLPAGVSWSGTTISGAPTVSGNFDVTVTVTSDQTPDQTATADVTITIYEAPEFSITGCPTAPIYGSSSQLGISGITLSGTRSILWESSDFSTVSITEETTATPTLTFNKVGTVIITATVTDSSIPMAGCNS